MSNHPQSSETVNNSTIVVEAWDGKVMPAVYHQTMYKGDCAVILDIFEFQKEWMTSMINENTSFVEIGCGTAEMGSILFQQARYTVGLDKNNEFLALAIELHPAMIDYPTNFLIEGNATEAMSLLKSTLPEEFWDTKRIVSMLMNTF
eukprot:CAMPEP_0182424616 /NCGR_PEP_ID=MMETSP1167-20130531/10842_1 /TAXON_ID=2988 /ORGANISM="Mallomonas Sp, Strain CCMP3275" /LENGTH=146 /DNA_ID=CAMNT_0024604563 /DNA_START=167 /DNA_END=604 /DNA_ORIENTATION=+